MTTAQFTFMDGGERNPSNVAYYQNVNLNAYEIQTFNGVYFFYCQNTGTITWTPNFSSTTLYFGCRFVIGSGSSTLNGIFLVNSENNTQVYVTFNSNGSISVISGTTTLATSNSDAFFANTSIFLEMKVIISATVGQILLYLNGNPTPLISVSNVNTANDTTSLPITNFVLKAPNGLTLLVRDLYVHDGTGSAPFNNILGEVTCALMEPNADVVANFSPVGNSQNYLNINTTSPNSSDYNSGTTAGQEDTYTVSSLPSNTSQIIGIKLFDYSFKSDAGARSLAKIITSGTTTGTGTVNYLNGTATLTEDLYTLDPNTGSAFTLTSADNLVIGYKIIS